MTFLNRRQYRRTRGFGWHQPGDNTATVMEIPRKQLKAETTERKAA